MQLSDFQYALPDDRIARYPLAERDQSKLLQFRKGEITHHSFKSLPRHLPENSFLVFNNTKVIPARAALFKAGGARIELLLLQPVAPSSLVSVAMEARSPCTWVCMIGNKKRWKPGDLLTESLEIGGEKVVLTARWNDRERNLVDFTWDTAHPFVDILLAIGQIPLPPYLGREAEEADAASYQTVYAQQNGAVAAPTAGLHFTQSILDELTLKGIKSGYVTLHVGAGTFQPIKTEDIRQHQMHAEQLVFTRDFLEKLVDHTEEVVAVGTTSLRSLESLYWFGVKCLSGDERFFIQKEDPYNHYQKALPPRNEAIRAILAMMERQGLEQLLGDTEIFITPGYRFRVVDALLTNFHQPGSTLVLLIAAFTGRNWRKIYDEALDSGYRFLSYGDSSLLWYDESGGEKW